MADAQNHSEILVATATGLYELASNLASSNLAEQPEGSLTLSYVRRALEMNRAVGHHLAALAVAMGIPDPSATADLASSIENACVPHTLNLTEGELESIYDARPDSEEDCMQVCYSDGYSGHYLCEMVINEATFPCLGCPLVVRQFADLHHRPDQERREPVPVSVDRPRNPGPPARRMMMDLADAVNALCELDLSGTPAATGAGRRLTYIAIALAQLADYGVNIHYHALLEMAQLERSSAWDESAPQAERAFAIDRMLYKMVTGSPFTEPNPDARIRRNRCEQTFQARSETYRYYCNYLDTIPAHLQEDETVGEICQRCPFHQSPPHPSLLDLATT